jgi:hypothetical protein
MRLPGLSLSTRREKVRFPLALFKINDPSISHLCGAFGQARVALYYYIVEHINHVNAVAA